MTARPYFKKRGIAPRVAGAGPWKVADLCKAYNWPTAAPGGLIIAIIELGGGWTSGDMSSFASANGLPSVPTITDVSVDGTVNTPGGQADGEVALDIQVSWAAYRAATGKDPMIRVYWCQDIATGVRAAYRDGCSVCSISWGADEAEWPTGTGPGSVHDMDAAVAEGLAAGMITFAAAGDNDSSDGGPNAANVDCPASCPNLVGCGGTSKSLTAEVVWNNEPGHGNGSGTGGGYSTIFAMPAWQSAGGALAGPTPMRMVPDVAANADPDTGYEIFYQGSPQVVGGTSAVAPLYAGLFAALGVKLGGPGALWQTPSAFVDIVSGDNGAYAAAIGPDPCTGLGVPNGAALDQAFAPAAPSAAPTTPGS